MKKIRIKATTPRKIETLGSLLGETEKEFVVINVEEVKEVEVHTIGELLE